MIKKQKIGFAGLGLIGGSIARALRRVRPELHLIAYDADMESLTAALEDGVINEAHDALTSAFAECDLIFLCAPVQVNIEHLKQLSQMTLGRDTLITDVGSVKSVIRDAVAALGMTDCFIGGHPMAGSEKSGYKNASDRLVENAYYILTPFSETSDAQLESLSDIVQAAGAIPVVLDPDRHDAITAAISHLPQLLAYTLVNLVRLSDDDEAHMRMLAAGGFKDMTRIASSAPDMWIQICEENGGNITAILDAFIRELTALRANLSEMDTQALYDCFSQAKDFRDAIPKTHAMGALPASNEIYVDLVDEAGAIAIIASILSANKLSIRNIGIVHNREFQDGALRIEFYDAHSAETAVTLLRRFNYVVHERQ